MKNKFSFINTGGGKYILIGFIVAAVMFLASLFTGKYSLDFSEMIRGNERELSVFFTLRLPRTLAAVFGGFVLGITGHVYQTVFKNPLASPDIIGVSSGASAGAAFGILFVSSAALPVTVTAFGGGLAAVALCLGISAAVRGRDVSNIVLSGIAVNSLSQTALMLLKLTADPEKELASIEYWIMGSLNAITLNKLPALLIISSICIAAIFILHRQILLLSIDEDEANMLGVPVFRMRFTVLILATLATASVISVTGLISFIGLLAPHISRLLIRSGKCSAMLLSGITGGVLLCAADILARTAASSELPVSIFTSLLGAPFLIYWLIRRKYRL